MNKTAERSLFENSSNFRNVSFEFCQTPVGLMEAAEILRKIIYLFVTIISFFKYQYL